jgi:hypothetical protein
MRSNLFASTLAIALGVASPIVEAIGSPEIAVAQTVGQQKVEADILQLRKADRLFREGIQKIKKIEDLRTVSRNSTLSDTVNYRSERDKISLQIDQIRKEAVQNFIDSIQIYRHSRIRHTFPTESHQSESQAITKLIEFDFDDRLGSEQKT